MTVIGNGTSVTSKIKIWVILIWWLLAWYLKWLKNVFGFLGKNLFRKKEKKSEKKNF